VMMMLSETKYKECLLYESYLNVLKFGVLLLCKSIFVNLWVHGHEY